MNVQLVTNTTIEHIAKSIPSILVERAIKEIATHNDDMGMNIRLAQYFNKLVEEYEEIHGEPIPWYVKTMAI